MKRIFNPWEGMEGYHCYGCDPHSPQGLRMEFYEDGDDIVSVWKPRPEFQGWVDTLHGGIQATLQNFGMFLVASYIISPLAIALSGVTDGLAYYQMVYVLTGALCVIAALSLLLFPNVRSSVAGKMEDDHVQAHAATEK